VRATGGFARSDLWRRLLTDTLDLPVGFPTVDQGSAFGAALLGMQAVGLLPAGADALVDAGERIPLGETLRPGGDAATYAARLPVFEQVYDALGDVTAALGQSSAASATPSSSTRASSR
jgi:gluconokinase